MAETHEGILIFQICMIWKYDVKSDHIRLNILYILVAHWVIFVVMTAYLQMAFFSDLMNVISVFVANFQKLQ